MARVLILIHGNSADAREMAAWARAAEGASVGASGALHGGPSATQSAPFGTPHLRTLAWDLPLHGANKRFKPPLTIAACAADLEAKILAATAPDEEVSLAGFSDGANIALALLQRNARPYDAVLLAAPNTRAEGMTPFWLNVARASEFLTALAGWWCPPLDRIRRRMGLMTHFTQDPRPLPRPPRRLDLIYAEREMITDEDQARMAAFLGVPLRRVAGTHLGLPESPEVARLIARLWDAPPVLRPFAAADRTVWQPLWETYCRDVGSEPPAAAITEGVWQRLTDPDFPLFGVWAELEGRPAGFAHYVLHPHTWSLQELCYLEDLYVAPWARGRDVGHALISYLTDLARQRGWRRVYWHTQQTNLAAQRLYKRFASPDPFLRYTLPIS